jgi:hypothetical protein
VLHPSLQVGNEFGLVGLGYGVGAVSRAWHGVGVDVQSVGGPVADDARQAAVQGIRVPGVGPEMGPSGQLQWASCMEKKRKGNEKENGSAGDSAQERFRKY